MTDETGFIAANWGNSQLRAYLVDAEGAVLDRTTGPGVMSLTPAECEAQYLKAVGGWLSQSPTLSTLMCGAVGSNAGWHPAPYCRAPATLETLGQNLVRLPLDTHRIDLVPGVQCTTPFDQPDVMRGEEIEALGWASLRPGHPPVLFCAPGTHGKWVLIENGEIRHFFTGYTGELYALLAEHSLLVFAEQAPRNEEAFLDGIRAVSRCGHTDLLHLLFTTRSRQLTGELDPSHATAYLSGLIIGRDVFGALRIAARHLRDFRPVLVASDALADLYDLAFGAAGLAPERMSIETATVAGLNQLHRLRQGVAA